METTKKELRNRFEGKVAVVTGGGSGIGCGMCHRFAQAGMSVVVADIEEEAAERTCAELEEHGARALAVVTDVSERASVERLAELTVREMGGAHVLCNNAGVFVGGALQEATENDWHWMLSVNLMGVVHGCHAFVPRMIEQGQGGSIVNTASPAGLISGPGLGVYSATKFAVVGFSESLRGELEPHGINVTILCPGSVRSRLPDADRNRPARYGESGGSTEKLREVIADGMDPLTVGDIVLEALADDAFYVCTHKRFRDPIAERYELILSALDAARS